jgi:hypothetical protein
VDNPDFFQNPPEPDAPRAGGQHRTAAEGIWGMGDKIVWLSALILSLSTFMGWYTGSGVGVKLAVIGWHTGTIGKLVFFIGLVVLAIVALRESGVELPPSVPESLVILGLGSLATVFVLMQILSIPTSVLPADSLGIGIWISLVASLGVIAGGLLRASEEL